MSDTKQLAWDGLSLAEQFYMKKKGYGPEDLGCESCGDGGMIKTKALPGWDFCHDCPLGEIARYLTSNKTDWDHKPQAPKPPGFEMFLRHGRFTLSSWDKLEEIYKQGKLAAVAAVKQFIDLGVVHTGIVLEELGARVPLWLDGATTQLENYLPGLYLFGDVGRGKSTMLSIIMHHLSKESINVRAVSWSGLVSHIQAGYTNNDRTKEDVLKPYVNAEYLLIDDLGDPSREEATDDRRDILWLLLSPRYDNNRRGLVITSNMDPARFRKYFGDRIADRVLEDTAVFKLAGTRLPSRQFGKKHA